MVNNSTNINKTNNYLSPETIEHKFKTMTYGVEKPGLGFKWERHKKVAGLNRLMVSQYKACNFLVQQNS
jgi:hypothetical protein